MRGGAARQRWWWCWRRGGVSRRRRGVARTWGRMARRRGRWRGGKARERYGPRNYDERLLFEVIAQLRQVARNRVRKIVIARRAPPPPMAATRMNTTPAPRAAAARRARGASPHSAALPPDRSPDRRALGASAAVLADADGGGGGEGCGGCGRGGFDGHSDGPATPVPRVVNAAAAVVKAMRRVMAAADLQHIGGAHGGGLSQSQAGGECPGWGGGTGLAWVWGRGGAR